MKTFSEALNVAFPPVPDETQAALERGVLAIADMQNRYGCIADEAVANPQFRTMVDALIIIASSDSMAAIFTAFMNGLVVGMEMERQENLPT